MWYKNKEIMTKEEKIKEVYESFGFNWNECEKYISNEGVLVLPTPDLKYNLKGYEKLIEDEGKLSSFGNGGLMLQPSLLKGLFNNNGWTKIEREDWLKETYIDGRVVRYYVDNIKDDYFDIAVQINDEEKSILGLSDYLFIKEELDRDCINPTHYQQIKKPNPPIY